MVLNPSCNCAKPLSLPSVNTAEQNKLSIQNSAYFHLLFYRSFAASYLIVLQPILQHFETLPFIVIKIFVTFQNLLFSCKIINNIIPQLNLYTDFRLVIALFCGVEFWLVLVVLCEKVETFRV